MEINIGNGARTVLECYWQSQLAIDSMSVGQQPSRILNHWQDHISYICFIFVFWPDSILTRKSLPHSLAVQRDTPIRSRLRNKMTQFSLWSSYFCHSWFDYGIITIHLCHDCSHGKGRLCRGIYPNVLLCICKLTSQICHGKFVLGREQAPSETLIFTSSHAQ